jgi:hypothetical protein
LKIQYTKYKRSTPKSHVELLNWKLDLGIGIERLLKAVGKLIEKYFGLLYANRLLNVFA